MNLTTTPLELLAADALKAAESRYSSAQADLDSAWAELHASDGDQCLSKERWRDANYELLAAGYEIDRIRAAAEVVATIGADRLDDERFRLAPTEAHTLEALLPFADGDLIDWLEWLVLEPDAETMYQAWQQALAEAAGAATEDRRLNAERRACSARSAWELHTAPARRLAVLEDAERFPVPLTCGCPDCTRPTPPPSNPAPTGEAMSAPPEREQKTNQAAQLLAYALENYRFGQTTEGAPFAVPKNGPRIARMLRGDQSLRAELARKHAQVHGKPPTQSALADVMLTLEGEALAGAVSALALRSAEVNGNVVVDLGDESGRVVVVDVNGWRVADRAPTGVLFRRTKLTASMPEPQQGGSLAELRRLLNVTDESWPLLVGWLVACFLPDMPHPILLLQGEQGAGKSEAARALVGLVDPSAAPLRQSPREGKDWNTAALASWTFAVDNVSYISEWWSDALCRAVTGDASVDRKLYADDEAHVVSFRRCIVLTSIDPGGLRGDLADRLVPVNLESVAPGARREETEIRAALEEAAPQILGALLELVAGVLREREAAREALTSKPRMADFAVVLAALDRVSPGLKALERYLASQEDVVMDVLDADAVAYELRKFAVNMWNQGAREWEGTASELLAALTPLAPTKYWPKTPRALSGRLTRLASALRKIGIDVGKGRTGEKRTVRVVLTADAPPSAPSGDGLSPAELDLAG